MLVNDKQIPSLLIYLQIIVLSAVLLYFGKTLFIPLFFGLLIAIVMYPVSKWLEQRGWNKLLATTSCLLIVTLLLAALLALLAWQVQNFCKDVPVMVTRLEAAAQQFQKWISSNIAAANNIQYNWTENLTGIIGTVLQSTVQASVNTLFIFFLTPVYTALFLYHRKIFVQYLKSVVPGKYRNQLDIILQQTIHTYFNYIKGMILVYLIVGILNTIGLLALGVRNALLFGMLCAIMTIIPYIGIFVSALLPIAVVWMDKENIWYPIGVVAVFSFVQYLEANVIFPKVVGTQLNVSTFAMLVAIIAGGIIWGAAGMVLFIPFVAILKIAAENIEEWEPLNLLLSRK